MTRAALTLALALAAPLALLAPARAQDPVPRADRAPLREIMSEALGEYRRTAAGNPAGEANYEHVRRMIEAIEARGPELRRLGADPLALQAGILFSDLGKGGPRLESLARELFPREYAESPRSAMFRAFLLHEVPGRQEFLERARAAGLSPATIRAVEAANVGHNGPAASGSFWQGAWDAMIRAAPEGANLEGRHGALAAEYLGRAYPEVRSIEGAVHAGLDRRDQGTRDGSLKILGEIMGRGEGTLRDAFREAFAENQRKTLLQFEQLRRRYPQIFELDIVRDAERDVRQTTRYGNHVSFDRAGERARVHLADGRTVEVRDAAGLSEVLRSIEVPAEERTRNRGRPMSLERFRETERGRRQAQRLARRTIPELVQELRRRGERPAGTSKAALVAQLSGVRPGVAEAAVRRARSGPAAAARTTARAGRAGRGEGRPSSLGMSSALEGLAPNRGRGRSRGR